MVPDSLLNPFAVDPRVELPHPIEPVPLWTEYCYFFGYDLQTRTGLSVHIGREPFDPQLWRATLGIYLSGEDLLVAKCVGRNGHGRGPGTGPLRITCLEPMRLWSIEFDGVAHASTRTELTREVLRDSPGEPLSFYLLFEGAAPFWDMHQTLMKEQSWGSRHWEQICRVRGEIRCRGNTLAVAGAGVRDHSVGPRDYAPVIGNFWANGFFPESGRAFMAQLTRSANLGAEIRHGYVFRNDGTPLEVVKLLESPPVNTATTSAASIASDPLSDASLKSLQITLATSRGKEVIDGELLHSIGTTYLSPSEELIGTDFARDDGLQLTESAARFRWNGEVGLGVRERIAGIRTLRK